MISAFKERVWLCETIQEPQSNDDSVTDNLLYCKNLNKTKDSVWGMTTRMIEILHEQRNRMMTVQLTDELFLASQKSEENQGWYLENDNENDKINEILLLTTLILYLMLFL